MEFLNTAHGMNGEMKTFLLEVTDWFVGFLLVLWIASDITAICFWAGWNEPSAYLWLGIGTVAVILAWILLELTLPYRDDARPAMVRGQANEPTF